MSRLLLFDANNCFMRGFKASVGVKLSANGMSTAGLLFFINTVTRHIRTESPDLTMACWDGGRSKRRAELSPVMIRDGKKIGYKANREEGVSNEAHFQLARQFLDRAGIGQFRQAGEEADDLIAGYVLSHPEHKITIVSDDHDLRQLVSENVTQMPLSPGSPQERWTPESVREHYGFGAADLPRYMALTGDPGDGVEGVAGVGPIKALKLLQSHDFDWPALLDDLDPDDRAAAILSYVLVDLLHPLPSMMAMLPDPVPFEPRTPDHLGYEEFRQFLNHWEMGSVLKRLDNDTLWPALRLA